MDDILQKIERITPEDLGITKEEMKASRTCRLADELFTAIAPQMVTDLDLARRLAWDQAKKFVEEEEGYIHTMVRTSH